MTVPAFHVKHLDHVTIVVRDLDATRRFYVEVLGMQEVPRPGFAFAGQWFQAGGTQIHTILECPGSGPAGWGAGNNSRGHHFAFQVEDAEAAARRLTDLGIAMVSPPKHRPDGAVQVFVQDPDGHLVELCSFTGKSGPTAVV
jgi:catechol 2,3-dioxygenase-like lactoylglutathione lyase family enzyme